METGVTETNLLSAGREGSRAFAYLTLTPERFTVKKDWSFTLMEDIILKHLTAEHSIALQE